MFACCASAFEITNLSAQKTQYDCERLFLRAGLRFYDERNRKVEKALQVHFLNVPGLYYIYLVFFLFDKGLNVFVYVLAFNKSKNKIINLAYSSCYN